MKKVIHYQATDGKLFSTEEECERYESNGCVDLLPLPDYGDHVPLTADKLRWMLYGDGDCYYATATKMTRVSAHSAPHPDWATHLIYFGK